MHKMIRADRRIISKRYDKAAALLNIPSVMAAVVLSFTSLVTLRAAHATEEAYRYFFLGAYITALYSFTVTFIITVYENRALKGHEKYSYIEITGPMMIMSEYTGAARIKGELVFYRRVWVVDLTKVEEVRCTKRRMIVKTPARRIEQRADWLGYTVDEYGKVDFDFWEYNEGGGELTETADIRDCYFFPERIAQRIIFCSEKEKAAKIRREEFMKQLFEMARKSKEARRKKKKQERVFRGYEIKRNF